MTRDEFITLLHGSNVAFSFKRADGTVREMKGTLNKPIITEAIGEFKDTSTSGRKPNPNVQVVFDLEQNAWRSFRWDRLVNPVLDQMDNTDAQ